jgi:translocation and assembly module TamB
MAPALHHRHAPVVIANGIKYLLLALVVIALTAVLAGLWLTESSSGSRWLWKRVVPAIPGELTSRSTEGSIGDGFRLAGLSYVNDGVEVDVAEATITARLVLFPLSIDVRELRAEGIVVRLKETAPPAESGPPLLEQLSLPFALNVRNAGVSDLQVLNSAGQNVFLLHRATFAGRWHDEISLQRFEFESDAGNANGTIRLALARPHAASAAVAGSFPLRIGEAPVHPLEFHATAEGSLADLAIDASSREPAVHVVGRLRDLNATPGWDVRLESSYFQWPLGADAANPPQVYLKSVDLRTSGDLADYTVTGGGDVSVSGTEELSFRLATDGSRDGLEVSELQLAGNMLAATADGQLRWSGGFAVAADANVDHFDVSMLTEQWPAGLPLSGTVDAAWSAGNLRLNEVRIRVEDALTTVDATGEIDIDGGVVDLDLDWRELEWPLTDSTAQPDAHGDNDAATTRFVSEFGQVNVSGSPDSWEFEGRAAFRADTLPQGVFVLTGNGDRDEVRAMLNESHVLGGSASGRGSYNWAEGGRWSAELAVQNLDVSPLVPELTGRINSVFTAEGRLEPLQFAIDFKRLEGSVRDQSLKGEGGIRYADGNLSASKLKISSGDSELQADGSLEGESGLDFRLHVAALEAFHPALAGFLRADGNLSLSDEFPSLRMNLEARDLYWDGYALQALQVTAGSGRSGLPLSLDATGTTLSVGTREFRSVSVVLEAGPGRQRLQVELSPDEQALGFELDGRLDDWRQPLESVWTGQLRSAQFAAPQSTRFALVEPAGLRLSAGRVSLQRACLLGSADGRMCLDADWTRDAGFELVAELNRVPVSLIDLLYATDLEYTQTLSGSLTLGSDKDQTVSGAGQIDIAPGRIRNRLDPRLTTETGAGEFSFGLAGGQLLSGRLTLPFSGAGEIDAQFEAADIGRGSRSPVEGQLRINLRDIALAANVVPMIDEAHGRLDIDLDIGGTLGNPLFSGAASLQSGSFRYERLGLELTDIELQSVVREGNSIDLNGTFKAGEGTGEMQSSTRSLNAVRDGLELSLTGKNLTLIDLPDITVVADPDLSVGVRDAGLTINGNILIPRARVTPADLTSGDKVSESADVVIVANGGDEVATANGDSAPFEIHGTVALVLGSDVVVDLDVAEARVSGTSAFHWSGPHMPVAQGLYNIEGRFQAYGQLLDITEGTIRFPGVPASSPNLRIRAEREIFGNPQIRSAGVLVTGTPQNPMIEVYTNPATSRDRALTLLVTGSDFNYEQGVGAVDVGTYIAPDLYISYGIGLFERGNVISLRYDIAKGFGIKATSGKNAEGVDLSYTLER